MCYCPTPTLHLNLALTGDCAFQLSPKKPHSVWFISVLKSGDMGQCPEKSPSPCNTCVIPVSLYKSMSWLSQKRAHTVFLHKHITHHTHTHTHTHFLFHKQSRCINTPSLQHTHTLLSFTETRCTNIHTLTVFFSPLSLSLPPSLTHTHTPLLSLSPKHTHTHTHPVSCMQTHTHPPSLSASRAQTHSPSPPQWATRTNTRTHAHTHTHARTHTRTRTHTCTEL